MALTQVSASGIKDGSISSNDLADGSISTSKIADDAITADKLNNTGVTAGSYTLSSVTVDAQGRVTAASSGTPVDADKIIEGNTEVEAVDTGSDGHIKATTEGSERLRVGPAGQVGIGGANYGTSGQVLMSGGASAAPTWGDVSASPSFEATASGALTDGAPVVINSDGTVSVITGSGSIATKSTDYGGTTDNSQYIKACYDTGNDKLVAVYVAGNHNDRLHCVIGNVSGTTVTWGSEFQLSSVNGASDLDIVYMPDVSRVLVVYREGNYNTLHYVIGQTNSGSNTTGSFTGPASAVARSCETPRLTYDTNTNKVVLAYADNSNGQGRVRAGTPGTNSITWGTEYSFFNNSVNHHLAICFDSYVNRVLIAYRDNNDSNRGKAIVADVASNNNISLGTAAQFTENAHAMGAPHIAFNAAENKSVIAYHDESNSTFPKPFVTVATINTSNNSVSFGQKFTLGIHHPATNFIRPQVSHSDLTYSSNGERLVFAFSDQAQSEKATYISFRLVGGGVSIAEDDPVIVKTTQNDYINAVYDPDTQNTHIIYRDINSAFAELQSVVIKPNTIVTNLQTNNFIGISNAAYSNGQTATIQLASSVDDAQSGLTPGTVYYINQNNGSLQTTPDVVSAQAGVAVAATKLLIK